MSSSNKHAPLRGKIPEVAKFEKPMLAFRNQVVAFHFSHYLPDLSFFQSKRGIFARTPTTNRQTLLVPSIRDPGESSSNDQEIIEFPVSMKDELGLFPRDQGQAPKTWHIRAMFVLHRSDDQTQSLCMRPCHVWRWPS